MKTGKPLAPARALNRSTFASLGLLALTLLFLSGCSPKVNIGLAETVVDQFHDKYSRDQFAEIYSSVDDDFRSSAKLPEWVAYQKSVKDTLGNFRSTELTNFNVMYVWGKSEVRLDYLSQFEKGKAQETFEVSVRRDKAVLSGYRVDSPLLPKEK